MSEHKKNHVMDAQWACLEKALQSPLRLPVYVWEEEKKRIAQILADAMIEDPENPKWTPAFMYLLCEKGNNNQHPNEMFLSFFDFLNEKYPPNIRTRLSNGTLTHPDEFRIVALETDALNYETKLRGALLYLLRVEQGIIPSFLIWFQTRNKNKTNLLLSNRIQQLQGVSPVVNLAPSMRPTWRTEEELEHLRQLLIRPEMKVRSEVAKLGIRTNDVPIQDLCKPDAKWRTGLVLKPDAERLRENANQACENYFEKYIPFPCLDEIQLTRLYHPPSHPSHPFERIPGGPGYTQAKRRFKRKTMK